MRSLNLASTVPMLVIIGLAPACGDDATSNSKSPATSGGAAGSGAAQHDQLPPEGASAIEAWLKTGAYKSWHCEPSRHEARSPSPHGINRICSNDAIAKNAAKTSDWPKGAAAVKEYYASNDDKEPAGYAVYEKTDGDSAGGDNWYWYERLPLDSKVPHDADGVVADGMGDSGTAKTICVACHAAAGSDAAHTPSPNGRDQVYTPVE